MSIASYFFIGTDDEAQRNDGLEGSPADHRAEFYRVMDTSIKPIYTILTGEKSPSFEPVVMNDDFSQITFLIPEKFVQAAASIEPDNHVEILKAWKETEDAPYDNDKDLTDLLAALAKLSRKAIEDKQNLYLWNCL
ncbi:hypothetical protein C5Y96_15195 [Blastopirellula marina]|uniref:Uncharacterized protein n=1 Tax=Blastopirellula marina TaxID=124 RepID=A0A2S8FAE8_9BACT|nr:MULTISPECIES: hypothetical protein [Pirellulaceae]PQO29100.1 hypothetical protein C5Y96_15195 [Blastopirellula marina]RCS50291.1 hypothetical protein DTL36_15205 [Bremerella cremea]